ncbi:hypothetical protein ABIA00_007158 [Bradyrhizobium ottawaense]
MRSEFSNDCVDDAAEAAANATAMKIKLSVAIFAMMVSRPTLAAPLTEAEAAFLDQLVTASVVLEQRCDGYEVDGSGSVQLGARLLGSPDVAMAMIDAYAAAIRARDGESYDPGKFRPEVSDAASKTFRRIRTDLIRNPKRACADYGEASVDRGLLRRY